MSLKMHHRKLKTDQLEPQHRKTKDWAKRTSPIAGVILGALEGSADI